MHFVDAQVFSVQVDPEDQLDTAWAIEEVVFCRGDGDVFRAQPDDPRVVPDDELPGYAVVDWGDGDCCLSSGVGGPDETSASGQGFR